MEYNSLKTTLDYALHYLELGWSVIPFGASGERLKKSHIRWKPFQTRLATREEIEKWFPDSTIKNVGMVTGEISGVFVLDVDSEEGYQFVTSNGIPETVTARSGSGNWHFFFQHPGWYVKTINYKRKPWGCPDCDIKGDKGIVVLTPSRHPSGGLYSWEKAPEHFAVAQAPG